MKDKVFMNYFFLKRQSHACSSAGTGSNQ